MRKVEVDLKDLLNFVAHAKSNGYDSDYLYDQTARWATDVSLKDIQEYARYYAEENETIYEELVNELGAWKNFWVERLIVGEGESDFSFEMHISNLKHAGPKTIEGLVEDIFEATKGDGDLASCVEPLTVIFSRYAKTYGEAIQSAKKDLEKIGLEISTIVRLDQ